MSQKIDGKYIEEVAKRIKAIKLEEKVLNEAKEKIKAFLESRGKKPFDNGKVKAFLSVLDKTIYNVPAQVKKKYAELKHFDVLKIKLV